MSNKVASSLFTMSSLKLYTGFYQQLLSNISSLKEVGNKLIQAAEAAYWFRDIDKVNEAGLLLSNLPLRDYQLIGQYYLGWCAYRNGNDAKHLFETIIEQSDLYRTKALISLAAIETGNGDIISGFTHYNEAAKRASNFSTYISASKAIAVIKSIEGHHQQALKDLESLVPFVRHASPKVYYDYLNSYAVELSEVGRMEEACNISKIIIASPLTQAYPEWRETHADIHSKRKNHSTVHISIKEHVSTDDLSELTMPVDEIDTELAAMFDKEFVPGYPQPFDPEITEAITSFDELAKYGPRVLLAVLLRMILGNRITEKEIQVICDVCYSDDETTSLNISSEPPPDTYHSSLTYAPEPIESAPPVENREDKKSKQIDLENIGQLEKIITNWCNQDITPEEIATVLSALRDCDNSAKLRGIIDRMISIAFQNSRQGYLSENEWRSRYEARLKSPQDEEEDD